MDDKTINALAGGEPDPADAYSIDAKNFLTEFEQFAVENFGERCDTTDENCPCCKLWKLYDQTKELVDI